MPDVNMMWNIHSWVEYFGVNNEKQCDALIGAATYLSFPKFTLSDGSITSVSDAYFTTRPCIRSTMVETIPGKQVFLAQGLWTYPTPPTTTATTTTTTTTTTIPPATTTVAPRDQLLKRTVGTKCLKVGAKRKVGNKTLTCKKVSKSLKWVA